MSPVWYWLRGLRGLRGLKGLRGLRGLRGLFLAPILGLNRPNCRGQIEPCEG